MSLPPLSVCARIHMQRPWTLTGTGMEANDRKVLLSWPLSRYYDDDHSSSGDETHPPHFFSIHAISMILGLLFHVFVQMTIAYLRLREYSLYRFYMYCMLVGLKVSFLSVRIPRFHLAGDITEKAAAAAHFKPSLWALWNPSRGLLILP